LAENQANPFLLYQMITSHWQAQAIHVVAKLQIADLLTDGPKTSEQLATLTQTHPESLYRLLRALTHIGIFQEEENKKFSLTPLAEYLRSDREDSLRGMALVVGDDHHWGAWGSLLDGIKSGKAVFSKKFGISTGEYFSKSPAYAEAFGNAMLGLTKINLPFILNNYDFSTFKRVIDVGGNHGHLLLAILEQNPNAKGVLFDLPFVVEMVRPQLADCPVINRLEIVGGDLFESLPPNGDLYILKHIIHGCSDQTAVHALKNCRKAMDPDGTVLLIEFVIPKQPHPHELTPFLDLEMLVMAGGKERTEDEYEDLLAKSEFKMTRVIRTQVGAVSIIEAKRA
jgi:hypothetical protein